MNILTLIIGALLALAVGGFTVLLLVTIAFNVKAGRKYRETLARNINELRLSRMLGALGIDINAYLSTERSVDIHSQMQRCCACENTQECDDRLEENAIDAETIGFCNNEQTLQEIAARQRPEQATQPGAGR